ncbi:MAG: hypothetical protein JWL72_805, partial [Ilumatobacteraceae bacterium]|nr:hypothetical protein [Ilumatobacteraceae bacterium]
MNPSKRKMYAILAGVGISLGAAGIASAASTSSAPSNAAAVATAATTASTVESTPTDPTTAASTTAAEADANPDANPGRHTPTWTSSVTIAAPADGSKPTDAQLQAVATVTADQATAAALANTPGTAGTAELKSVAGNVVWDVDVTATAGGSLDVIVDAGNATV